MKKSNLNTLANVVTVLTLGLGVVASVITYKQMEEMVDEAVDERMKQLPKQGES